MQPFQMLQQRVMFAIIPDKWVLLGRSTETRLKLWSDTQCANHINVMPFQVLLQGSYHFATKSSVHKRSNKHTLCCVQGPFKDSLHCRNGLLTGHLRMTQHTSYTVPGPSGQAWVEWAGLTWSPWCIQARRSAVKRSPVPVNCPGSLENWRRTESPARDLHNWPHSHTLSLSTSLPCPTLATPIYHSQWLPAAPSSLPPPQCLWWWPSSLRH